MPIRIYIDQGHNPYGFNAGAEGFGLREQDITYLVGAYLANILNADSRFTAITSRTSPRSEERRVGKECRSRWSPYH